MNRFLVRLGKVLAISAMLGYGLAMAQAEPTMEQIYQTAKSGQVEQAQVMVQQVLIKHPNSAKAHFVQAELFARQGQFSRAREALASADKLAPGLPFANSEAIQALRAQVAGKPAAQDTSKAALSPVAGNNNNAGRALSPAPAPASSSGFPLGLGLALGGAAIALVIFFTRRKASPPVYAAPATNVGVPGNGLSGPQTFGTGFGVSPAANGAGPGPAAYGQAPSPQPGYGQPGYGQPGYGQAPYGQPPAAGGMGGRLAGGLATGLAVGAGVMAAEAIGRNLMGNNAHAAASPAPPAPLASTPDRAGQEGNNFAGNQDMGGKDFGINDGASWDDGGSGGGGGGDWDT